MKNRIAIHALLAGCAALLVATGATAAKPPQSWDGLELTKKKGLDLVKGKHGSYFASTFSNSSAR